MCDREICWFSDDECTADYHDAKRNAMGPCDCVNAPEGSPDCGYCDYVDPSELETEASDA